MPVTTGVPTLDEMLQGGYPEDRAILATGTPGTGKSTLAMQFLQAGLKQGDDCLYISTEQTLDELRDGFAPFPFDLDHENLSITSLHARTGRTLENDDEELVIERFDEGDIIGAGYSASFNSTRIRQVLDGYKPADRIVLDSVTGLEPMADSQQEFRRGVLDLIQQFTTDFEATTLLTAEYVGTSPRANAIETISVDNTIQYNVYGVLRLWREQKQGQYRRFIDVMKMRGVDHDTRKYELRLTEDGIAVGPNRQRPVSHLQRDNLFSTEIDELDNILGGGLIQNGLVLVKHDGHVQLNEFILQLVKRAFDTSRVITALPSARVQLDEIARALDGEQTFDELLDNDCCYILSPVDIAGLAHENVYRITGDEDYSQAFTEIHAATSDQERLTIFDLESALDVVSSEHFERMWRKAAAAMVHNQDVVIYIMNTNSPHDETQVFLEDSADQILRLWQEPDGLEYLKLEKSVTGSPGVNRLISLQSNPPYIELY